MMNYNIPIKVIRRGKNGEGAIELDMMCVFGTDQLYLPVDADIEEGDKVERRLPNGKVRTWWVTQVDVLESPFGSRTLDHTSVTVSSSPPEQRSERAIGDTFNVHATNVQVATGDYAEQTMTVGQTTDQLILVIEGIAEMLRGLGLTHGVEEQLDEAQQQAITGVKDGASARSAVKRFREWVIDCVQEGGSAAVVAAVTAATNTLMMDAESLSKLMGA